MAAAGAAEGDRQITFAFADVVRDQVNEQAFDALQKFAGLRKRTDVLADFWILPGEAAQTRNEMRIGQEAHVENEIGVGRNAVTIAEADARNQHRALFGIAE